MGRSQLKSESTLLLLKARFDQRCDEIASLLVHLNNWCLDKCLAESEEGGITYVVGGTFLFAENK